MLTQTEQEWSVMVQDSELFKYCTWGSQGRAPFKFQTSSSFSRSKSRTVEVRLCVDIYLLIHLSQKHPPRKNKADNSKSVFFLLFSSQYLCCSCFFGDVRCIPLLGYSVSAEMLRKGKECGSPPPPPPPPRSSAFQAWRSIDHAMHTILHPPPPLKNPACATGVNSEVLLSMHSTSYYYRHAARNILLVLIWYFVSETYLFRSQITSAYSIQ